MKTNSIISVLAICAATVFGGEGARPVISVPTTFTNSLIIVRDTNVDYRVESKNVMANFEATHSGILTHMRLVMGDMTVYKWDVRRDQSGKMVLEEGENGEHTNNDVAIDKLKWIKFFNTKVALPAFEYMPERSCTVVEDKALWEFVGYTDFLGVIVRTPGNKVLRTIKNNDLLFPMPKVGQYILARKDGKVCPIKQLEDGTWAVPVSSDDLLLPVKVSAVNQ